MNQGSDFYVGYVERAQSSLATRIRRRLAALLLVGVVTAVGFGFSQETLFAKRFEAGSARVFEGTLRWRPTPHLVVSGPDQAVSRLWLVAEMKFGAGRELAALDGQRVHLEGHLLYRGDRTMIEVLDGSARAIGAPGPLGGQPGGGPAAGGGHSLGTVRLVGEIVDSKCFLGAMNPGRSKVHRACAVRCISGGIPPALWVRGEGVDEVILLVDAEGNSVNDRVLDLVAESVQIEGELWRYDDLLVLRSDPVTYRRSAGRGAGPKVN